VPRDTLIDFFEDFAVVDDPFIVHDDGYRVRQVTYRELAAAARAFAARLAEHGVGADDTVVIWSENRPEWIAALWGCLLAGVVLVPVDFRASATFVRRITEIVEAKAILTGTEVSAPGDLPAPAWPVEDVITFGAPGRPNAEAPPAGRLSGSTLAEIVFTSGATGDPKGVTITHRNLLANIVPIEREIRKYRRYERPFHPIRFLNLLPLSHMFGQSMATFVPPMVAGTVIFAHGYSPTEILRQITSRRVSVLVCVPKVLDVLREHVERVAPETRGDDPLEGRHWLWRWWRYRRVHRLFGWKFWCVVCGAAPLEPALEAYWRKLGFLVVQGYGLTETAPIVTLNHPFHASRGTVGKPIHGVDVKIADDGEILVRGENVTAGYYRGRDATDAVESEDGWFHTGDIGELDAEGRLLIKGRKKEMIVTPQGFNVFPEDVERALLDQPGVREAGVIGLAVDGEERVHAVLVLDEDADPAAVVRGANGGLDDHQRIWSSSVWPGEALPRTEATQKLKRRELQQWAAGGTGAAPQTAAGANTVADVIARFVSGQHLEPETSLDEIGLSSLARVEMMMALEEAFQVTLDESQIAQCDTIADVQALVTGRQMPDAEGTERTEHAERTEHPAPGTEHPAPGTEHAARGTGHPAPSTPHRAPRTELIAFPSWNRTWPSRLVRRLSLPTWILPLAQSYMDLRVDGIEHLDEAGGPVIFAANHQSHMDTPAILIALPPAWRYRVAPAMAKEFFTAHFNPDAVSRKAWFTNSLNYYLACQFFNAFPLPQREAGTRQTLRYIGEVLAGGDSVLLFPEGRRTTEGISDFRPGVGMMASKLGVPVVPVRLEGLDKVLHQKMRWPERGPVRVAFGRPLRLKGDDYVALAKEIEEAVGKL
jgi:long-chain acyl-CoA synthetase